jgi:copper homeostasis protein CutC
MAVNYSVVVQAELDLKKIKEQLKEVASNGVDLKVHGAAQGKKEIDDVTKSTRRLNKTGQDLELTFNVAHEVFSKFLSVVKDMAGQVYELDAALTEFKKVSDLSGSALDDYVDKLSQLGQEVGRTGKPNRSEPVCCDGKAA